MLKDLPLGIYEKGLSNRLTWREKMELALESGFDSIELSIDATPERLCRLFDGGQEARSIQRESNASGCPVYTLALTANRMFPLGSEDAAIRRRGAEIVRAAIDFAGEAGVRLIHLAAYDEHGEKRCPRTEQLFVRTLRDCVAYAAAHGVILALETMDTDFMDSGRKVAELARMLDSPYLQCYADIGNLYASGIDPAFDLVSAGRHIVGVHLKDSRPGIYRDVPYGEGIVDFDCCFEILAGMGYAGFLTAEVWSYDDPAFHPYLREISRFLREKLKQY